MKIKTPPVTYSPTELNEFRKLVVGTESRNQVTRITARLEMGPFIEQVGKEKCDAMFEVLKQEIE